MAKEVKAGTKAGGGSEERIYTIPLRSEWLKVPRNKRSKRAVGAVKGFLSRHMRASDVRISQKLNEQVWTRGIQKPPAKVKVKATKDAEGVVTAMLPEEIIKEKVEKKGVIGDLKDKLTPAGEKAAAEKTEIVTEKPAKASGGKAEKAEKADKK